ncbi:MAG: hypothetical protein ACKOCE_11075 [Acidimicrobiia bacterium]
MSEEWGDDDFRDSEISALLDRLGGDAPATGPAYQHVLGRVRTIRRRRAIATSIGASVCVLAAGALVVRNSARPDDGLSLAPGAAVVTTPDGAVVTTPDGAVVTVITAPETTRPPSDSSVPGNTNPSTGPVSTDPSIPVVSTTQPTEGSAPNGTNRPTGENETPTTTRPAPPTTSVPAAPPTTKPETPPKPNLVRRACGAGLVRVEIANQSFVTSTLETVVVPGFNIKKVKASSKSIEVQFTSGKGKVTSTLKLSIDKGTVKDECEVENANEKSADDTDGADGTDNNGDRVDD